MPTYYTVKCLGYSQLFPPTNDLGGPPLQSCWVKGPNLCNAL